MTAPAQRRIVHPVCSPDCSHNRPNPGSKPEPAGVDWPALQEMVTEAVQAMPPMEKPVIVKAAVMTVRAWNEPEPEQYPEPSVTSLQGEMQPQPQPVKTLVRDMQQAGWTLMVQYAHGHMPHSTTGRPLAAQPSWAIRAYRGTWHAVAVYRGKAWDTLYTWSDQRTHAKARNVTEFRRRVLRDA